MITTQTLAARGGPSPRQFESWAATLAEGRGYTAISVPKRRRREARVVLRPSVGLDRTLKQLHAALEECLPFSPQASVHGFVRERGIVTNAQQHLDRDVVLRVDLRDFFGSVRSQDLIDSLVELDMEPAAAEQVAGLVTVDGKLPQGFSTSPFLSNVVFDATDKALQGVVDQKNVTYTRYADDLSFSGNKTDVNDQLLGELAALLAHRGWQVNDRKTRFMRRGRAQYVTGLSVDDPSGPHVPRVFKRTLRRELYFARKHGLADAREHSPKPLSQSQLSGWVEFVGHVEGHRKGALRAAWKEIAPPRVRAKRESWDDLLEDIGFPEDW